MRDSRVLDVTLFGCYINKADATHDQRDQRNDQQSLTIAGRGGIPPRLRTDGKEMATRRQGTAVPEDRTNRPVRGIGGHRLVAESLRSGRQASGLDTTSHENGRGASHSFTRPFSAFHHSGTP